MLTSFTSTTKGLIVFLIIGFAIIVFPSLGDNFIFSSINKEVLPTDNTPWHFIYQDFRSFLGGLTAILFNILLIKLFLSEDKKSRFNSYMLTSICAGLFLIPGILVLINCNNLFDPSIAGTNWNTVAEYSSNYTIRAILLIVYIVIVYFILKRYKKSLFPNSKLKMLAV